MPVSVAEPAEEAAGRRARRVGSAAPVAVAVGPPCAAFAEPAAGGYCHRRRCGQRAPLPHWWRLLPFPKPAFAGARTVARVSDGRRPPWELVAVAGAVCRRADARRHCLALLFPCAPPRRGSHVGLGVGAVRPVPPPRQTASQKTRRPLSPLCQRTIDITFAAGSYGTTNSPARFQVGTGGSIDEPPVLTGSTPLPLPCFHRLTGNRAASGSMRDAPAENVRKMQGTPRVFQMRHPGPPRGGPLYDTIRKVICRDPDFGWSGALLSNGDFPST